LPYHEVLTPKMEAMVRKTNGAVGLIQAERSLRIAVQAPVSTLGAYEAISRFQAFAYIFNLYRYSAAALVKINVDKLPAISDQLRIQSLPTVMLMVQGRFVDTFKARAV
jgi:hypothetical protein